MTGNQAENPAQDVTRRKVFYIPGYDPMLPRRYRELYRSEGEKQAKISGYEIDLKGKTGADNYSWSVRSAIHDRETVAEFEFLLWSDIVQSSMDRSIPATFLLLVRVVWIYLSTGALFRLTKLRKGPVIAALYPVFMLNLQLVVAAHAGLALGFGGSFLLPDWLAALPALAVFAGLMIWFRRLDNRFFAYYLLHDYGFSAQYYGAIPDALASRMSGFRCRIQQALEGDFDEVLLVGHSSGAHLGVTVLSDLLRQHTLAKNGPKLAFLTLGQVVPMVSYLPNADKLRGDLHFLCQQENLTWIDVTAPGDGCTFALCDPVAVSGAAPESGQIWPLVISAAFTQSMSKPLYDSMKWRFFRLHFQYLCAFDRPKDYDYFQITAGPISLEERYRGRVASPSRITAAHSPYLSRDTG